MTRISGAPGPIALLLLSSAVLQGCDAHTPVEAPGPGPLAASAPGTFAPPAPVGVRTVFQADSFAVEVSWSHDGTQRASGWRLERLDLDSAWTQVAADSGVGGRYLDASFPVGPARTLEYRVRVCNDAGCGTSSPTQAAVPGLPEPQSLRAVGGVDSVVVSWNQPNATAWITQVVRRTASTGYTPRLTTGPVVQSFTDGRVEQGVTYYYRVRTLVPANAPAGRYRPSPWSQAASATPGGAGGGGRPVARADAATLSSASSAMLHGAVTPNGLQTTAHYQWGTTPTLADAAETPVEGTGDGLSPVNVGAALTDLSEGVQYYYRLVATNAAGADSSAILPLRREAPAAPVVTSTFAQYAVVLSLKSPDATGFRVERRNGNTWAALANGYTGGTFTDATVPLVATHLEEYRVSACNAIGCSAPVETSVIVEQLPVPAAFGGVAAPNQVGLQWSTTGTPPTAFYQVRRRTAGTPYRARVTTAPGGRSFTDSHVDPDSTYLYQVRALLPTAGPGNRPSAWSGVLTIAPGTAARTASVTTGPVVVNDGRRMITGIVLGDAGATAFFETSDSPDLASFTTIEVPRSETSTTVSSTTSKRFYRVGARNAAGTVRGAIRSTAVTTPVLPAPAGVQGWFSGDNYTVQLRWVLVSGATSYRVTSTSAGQSPTRFFPAQPALEDPRISLHAAGTVTYVVSACTDAGCGPESEPVDVAVDPLAAPAGVELTAVGSGQVQVRWDDRSTGEDGFFVSRRLPGDVHFRVVGRVQRDGVTEYLDTGLTPGTTYEYRVQAYVDVNRPSAASEAVQVTLPR